MKTYFENFNVRTKMLLSNPKFYNGDPSSRYKVTMGVADNILTVEYGQKNAEMASPSMLFREILCLLSHQKNLSKIFELSFREIENFLRDENHLPAFHQEDLEFLQKCFKSEQIALVATVIWQKNSAFWDERMGQFYHWRNMQLVSQNQLAESIMAQLSEDLRVKWSLVWCDRDQLVVIDVAQKMDPIFLENLLLELVIEDKFHETKNLPIKVVAV